MPDSNEKDTHKLTEGQLRVQCLQNYEKMGKKSVLGNDGRNMARPPLPIMEGRTDGSWPFPGDLSLLDPPRRSTACSTHSKDDNAPS